MFDKLSQFWNRMQGSLFPFLEEELPPLTAKQQQLVAILEIIRIEEFIPTPQYGVQGRPEKSRKCLARAFVAKSVYNMPTTRMLIERLQADRSFRYICGWESRVDIPNESTFSRAFAEFAESKLPEKVHQSLITHVYKDKIVGHISRDSTAIKAREKPLKKEKIKSKKK